jgi:hypothetical protein
LAQLCRQADLPAGDSAEVIQGRGQWLLGDRKLVIAHGARRRLLIGRRQDWSRLYTGQKHGGGQQRQRALLQTALAGVG